MSNGTPNKPRILRRAQSEKSFPRKSSKVAGLPNPMPRHVRGGDWKDMVTMVPRVSVADITFDIKRPVS